MLKRIPKSPTVGDLRLSIRYICRSFSLQCSTKDRELEAALTRNRRWIVNNQIKNIVLRYPNGDVPVIFLQKKFKTLDLQGKALNWLKKYPCCYDVSLQGSQYYFRLTKRMMALVDEEEAVKASQEPMLVRRLAKLLMMSLKHRLNVVKFNELRRGFGFPDDYLIRIVPKHPDLFRLVNSSKRRNSMEIELVTWNPDLAVSALETSARELGVDPCFSWSLPSTQEKSWERFQEFNSSPYVSPYLDPKAVIEGSKETEKRSIGLVHELLSLSLWKKASILKLRHFTREFGFPEKLDMLLLEHPGIFYVSNKYRIHTVVLREAYNGSDLINKDPIVVVKDKFGELMQEGLHEYNRRHHLLNLEKKRRKGMILNSGRSKDVKDYREKQAADLDDDSDDPAKDKTRGLFDPEERKRFYKVLFEEDDP